MTVGVARFTGLIEGVRPLLPWLLATWFAVISAMRLAVLLPAGELGLDGRLYRAATLEWLAGGDPWMVAINGVSFGAPPPSLLPMIPFALVPEGVAVAVIIAFSVVGSLWAFRRLAMSWWWLAFPPLVDGMWNANPHVLVMPLIVAGLTPVAMFVKLYAGVVPAIRVQFRPLVIAALGLVVSAPFLPWATYFGDLEFISNQFRLISRGGLSLWSLPLPILALGLVTSIAALAVLVLLERERGAWAAMPAFWPWTEWYYSSLAIPAFAGSGPWLLAAGIMAIPLVGGPVLALWALALTAVAVRWRDRRRSRVPPATKSSGETVAGRDPLP